jgi:hypothetical protein
VIFSVLRANMDDVPETIRADALAAGIGFTERDHTPASQVVYNAWADAERDPHCAGASDRITLIARAVEHAPAIRQWVARLTHIRQADLTAGDVEHAVTVQVSSFDIELDDAALALWHNITVTFRAEQQPGPSER